MREAAVGGEGDEADAVTLGKGAAPVAPVFDFVGDVVDGLGDGEVRVVIAEGEVSGELDAGGVVFEAGHAGLARAGDFDLPRAAPEFGVFGNGVLGANVETACADVDGVGVVACHPAVLGCIAEEGFFAI